ncbi:DUF4153 domain-containing protein [Candidatus Peregrinibacteria bacterium]|nr:MAG: DUF4153 domain-containing protein [Candidatus Peregrinibacteria bacterium]
MLKKIRIFLKLQLATIHETTRRYPLAMCMAIIIAACAIMSERLSGNLINMASHRIMLAAIVVLPMMVFVEYQAREHRWTLAQKIGALITTAAVGVVDYGWLTAHQNALFNIHIIRQIMITLMAWVGLFVIPLREVSFKNDITWNWINDFIHKFLITFIYMLTLFGGISIILVTIETLFDITILERWYLYAWVIITSVLGTLFMLGQWPNRITHYNDRPALSYYESGFFRSIFLTLILAYTVILYTYGAKIIISGEWPQGQVAYWVSFYAAVGIIMYFYSHALLDQKHAVVRWFHQWFFLMLVPLIGLLYLAIKLRIDDYGLTVNRIFIIVIAAWLFLTALYYMLSKQKRLIWIPGTFLITVALTGFAPINAFNTSLTNQLQRMEAMLINNQWLNEKGQIEVNSAANQTSADAYQVSSIIRYVIENYGTEPLQPYFKENLAEANEDLSTWKMVEVALNILSFPNPDVYQNSNRHFFSDQAMQNGLVISGFDYYLPNFNPVDRYGNRPNFQSFTMNDQVYQLRWDQATKAIELARNDERLVGVSLAPTLDQLVIRSVLEDRIPDELALMSNAENGYRVQLIVNNLEINTTTGEVQYISVDVWVGFPSEQ